MNVLCRRRHHRTLESGTHRPNENVIRATTPIDVDSLHHPVGEMAATVIGIARAIALLDTTAEVGARVHVGIKYLTMGVRRVER